MRMEVVTDGKGEDADEHPLLQVPPSTRYLRYDDDPGRHGA